jgi:putative SOS response-associated peptidase YedK
MVPGRSHDRVPVFLAEEDYARWLSDARTELEIFF